MRFNYFVVAAVAAVSVNALPIYHIIQVPSIASFVDENVNKWLDATTVPEYCTKDMTVAPTANDLKKCMKSPKDVTDKALFWSRAGTNADYYYEVNKWRDEYRKDMLILDDFWLDGAVKTWAYAQAEIFGQKSLESFWMPASQAMAELANGEVLVLLPESINPVVRPDYPKPIVWYDIEYPALQKNAGVKGLYKVSPGSPEKRPVALSYF